MGRLCTLLTVAVGLIAPTAASALTASRAQIMVAKRLARVYGLAWTHHAPAWSQPECHDPNVRGQFTCETEFEYAGVWHGVQASVIRGAVDLYPTYPAHWVRRWRQSSESCTKDLVGQLFSNSGQCYTLPIYQTFGDSGAPPRVRYTGFKKHVVAVFPLSIYWPDFNSYACTWSNQTYQCLNRFGDGFRWKPYA